jgi:acyl carrier protein
MDAFRRILQHGLPQVAVSLSASATLTAPLQVQDTTAEERQPGDDSGRAARTHARVRSLQDTRVAPRDDVERAVADIWEELFGIIGIGVTDSFFDLGGHSLLAIQILSRINAELHTELTLQAFFEATTIAQLADMVRDAGPDPDLDALLAQMSDEEIERLLAERN